MKRFNIVQDPEVFYSSKRHAFVGGICTAVVAAWFYKTIKEVREMRRAEKAEAQI